MKAICFGLGILWFCQFCIAHESHSHEELRSTPSLAEWQSQLRAFSRNGAPGYLSAAIAMADYYRSQASISVQAQYLLAWTAQADHQFDVAHTAVAQLLRRKPGDEPAQLMQVALWMVQGNLARAADACRRLNRVSTTVRLLCQGQLLQSPTIADYQRFRSLVTLAGEPAASPSTGAWAQAVLGDLALRAGLRHCALEHYRAAEQHSPSVRSRTAIVNALMSLGRQLEALEWIPEKTQALGLQVKRLVILKALGQPSALRGQKLALAELFAQDLRLEDFRHGREMAEFYLYVLEDPMTAQLVLERSLLHQNEAEDRQLWQQAQLAAATRLHRSKAAQIRRPVALGDFVY